MNNEGSFFISDPNASDAIFLPMLIRAIDQLRDYWVVRYLSERSSYSREGQNNAKSEIFSHEKSSTEQIIDTHFEQEDSLSKQLRAKLIRLETMSYVSYNPHRYVPVYPEQDHPYRDRFDDNNAVPVRQETLPTVPSTVEPSLEDFLNGENLEFFYSVVCSDVLAGWPFADYLKRIESKGNLQQYLHFISDVEIVQSTEPGPFRDRILRHLIAK